MALETNSSAESGSVSRRTIIKGAAWAAPVMIAAVAVPSAVASPPTGVTPAQVLSVSTLKELTFTLTDPPATGTTVTVTISGAGWKLGQTTPRSTSTTVTTLAGGTFKVWVEPGGAASATLGVSDSKTPRTWGPFTSTLKKAAV